MFSYELYILPALLSVLLRNSAGNRPDFYCVSAKKKTNQGVWDGRSVCNIKASDDLWILIEYARMSEIEAVERRLGYLPDLIGMKHDIRPKSKTSYKLNPSIKEKGEFDNKWRIYVNEAIK